MNVNNKELKSEKQPSLATIVCIYIDVFAD